MPRMQSRTPAATGASSSAQPRSKRGFLWWMGRVSLWVVIAVLALVGAGAVYQAIATELDRRAFSPPGQLVDVGGQRLHILCRGEGSPTVILDAAADMMSADWAWVQAEVAQTTRVCAYDRGGMGWSDPGPLPRDGRQITRELHALLSTAGVPGPYVLVGHSAGGLYARLYADEHPQAVVGMVLVDPAHPDMTARIPALLEEERAGAEFVALLGPLARIGVLRLAGIGEANTQGLPPEASAAAGAFMVRPQHWQTLAALIAATPATYDQARATAGLGDRPLVILSATTAWSTPHAPEDETRRSMNTLHAELTELSTDSRHRVVTGATHGSLVHDRAHAQAVIDAILQVVDSVRTQRPLP